MYNITVLGGGESGASRVVRQILVEEGAVPQAALPPVAAPVDPELAMDQMAEQEQGDDYYKKVSHDIFHDIGKLAKSLSSTLVDLPAEDRRLRRVDLDEAGEKIESAKAQLQDIVSMTERATMEIMDQVEKVQQQTEGVQELLALLKEHNAFRPAAPGEEGEEETSSIAGEEAAGGPASLRPLLAKLAEAVALAASLQDAPAAAPVPVAPEPQVIRKTRHLFEIDVIFQTMYELCTNETVKTHITAARKAANEIFNHDTFIDQLGERIASAGLAPDGDNFFTVPLSDVLQSLLGACSDQKIQNLLKKMDLNQQEIFLDQSLPLEAPPTEEVEELVAGEVVDLTAAELPPSSGGPGADPRVGQLAAMVSEGLDLAEAMERELAVMPSCQPGAMSLMTLADQQDIFNKIEEAHLSMGTIAEEIIRITEALSFQDLSGQQILKIIKLLSDFQVQLLAIVVSFGSQLKSKEQNAELSVEESKLLAQQDVDKYLGSMTTEEVGGQGALDQDAINSLLAEMGF
ncbi:MAG: protein phosphatase CheZ [Thermodesulfobacteriota bacterium]